MAIPDDLQALLPKLQHLADYVAFESNDKKLWCYLSWTGDAPGDDPRDTTQEAYHEAKEIVEAAGYETEYNHIDHDSAIFDILPKKGNAMSNNLFGIPDGVDTTTAAYVFRGIATAMEIMRRDRGSYFSEVDRDIIEEMSNALRNYADEIEARGEARSNVANA